MQQRATAAAYMLTLTGDHDRPLGTFPITQPRFTLGALINPDGQDDSPYRFISLFGEDASRVSASTDVTVMIQNLSADYPEVTLDVAETLQAEPEIDVDMLVAWVHQCTGLDLDNLKDHTVSLTVQQASLTRQPG
jgi:hypothetical protein